MAALALSQLIVKSCCKALATAPANKVSSKLNRSFHAAQPKITGLSSFLRKSTTASKFKKEPTFFRHVKLK